MTAWVRMGVPGALPDGWGHVERRGGLGEPSEFLGLLGAELPGGGAGGGPALAAPP